MFTNRNIYLFSLLASSIYVTYSQRCSETLRNGARNECVKVIQRAVRVTADGIFGRNTEAAVKNYQRSKNLQADGIVGPRTWAAIYGDDNDGSSSSGGSSLNDVCLRCICEKESSCRNPTPSCHHDVNSDSCGYFQIRLAYYQDCDTPNRQRGQSLDAAWRACAANYDCAKRCVMQYMRKYASRCGSRLSCGAYGRLHNGGPNGCSPSNVAATNYGNVIQQCYNKKGG